MEIILATGNNHKLREFREMLSSDDVLIISQKEFKNCPEVIEDGQTFEENALIKARAIAQHTGRITIADDSGLEVDYLNGAPGIYSARFAGEDADDAKNNQKLLKELKGISEEKRGAQFTCVIAIVSPNGEERTVKGSFRGCIIEEYRGKAGFGYDPVFFDTLSGLTYSEMSAEKKNSISHRFRAIMELKKILPEFLKSANGQ
jgi:XTP/dITP diphosphohydrolase